MIRRLLAALLLAVGIAGNAAAATPGLVFRMSTSMETSTVNTPPISLTVPDTGAGNFLIFCIQTGTASVGISLSDNIGTGTWTLIKGATGNQIVQCYGQPNNPGGINKITIAATTLDQFDQIEYSEWFNISTAAMASVLDGTPVAATSQAGSPVATAAITTTAANSLVFQYTTNDSNTTPNTSYTKGSGFTLATANVSQSNTVQSSPFLTTATQYQVKATAGSVTPSITLVGGTGNTSDTIAFALKSASAGTAPPNGIYVCGVQKAAFDGNVTALVYQFPHMGNLIAVNTYNGNPSPTTITISDGDSHSYTSQIFDPSNTETRMFAPYAANVTPNTDMTGPSITYSSASGLPALGFTTLWDVCNAATSPFVQFQHNFGTQSVTGNLTTVSITPSNQNDVIIYDGVITSHTVSGLVTPSDANGGRSVHFDFPVANGGGTPAEDDDAHMYWYNGTSTSATSFVLSIQNNSAGVGDWAALVTEFTAPAAGGASCPSRPLLGVGC